MLKKYQISKFITKLTKQDLISHYPNNILLLKIYKLFFVSIFLFPIQGLGMLSGIPIMNSNKLIYSLLVFMIIFNIKILSRIILIIFLILLVL